MTILANITDKNHYLVTKLSSPITPTAEWDREPWNSILPVELNFYMGDKPDHVPNVMVKLAYDDDAIYVIYKVDDQYVLAATQNYQGPVYTDSCVEFFFTPHEDVSLGYFNLEMNCGGTALFNFQSRPRTNVTKISKADFDKIPIAHSMPDIVDPEISEPVTWTLEYRIPFSFLDTYSKMVKPAPGVKWRANFYKCADATSHPHWLTWSKVEYDRPNFHLPEFFGELEFGGATTVGSTDNKPESIELTNYPNPFNNSTTIHFSLPEAGHVKVSFMDTRGSIAKVMTNKRYNAGICRIRVDASDLAAGVYLCQIVGDGFRAVKRVTLIK